LSFCICQAKAIRKSKISLIINETRLFCTYSLHTQITPGNELNNQLAVSDAVKHCLHGCCMYFFVGQEKCAIRSEIYCFSMKHAHFACIHCIMCIIHQEMNSITNMLFLALCNIVYMVFVCHLAFIMPQMHYLIVNNHG